MVRVIHAQGSTEHKRGVVFSIDDKSAVLIVYADHQKRQPIAAYNREFWIAAELEVPGGIDAQED